MKFLCFAILLCAAVKQGKAQYYLRGNVRDEQGKALANVKILLHSKGSVPFYTGSSGAFGIPTNFITDTVTICLDRYETIKKIVDASKLQTFVLKPLTGSNTINRKRLLSFTRNLWNDSRQTFYNSNESYSKQVENNFIESDKYAETGFALNIDRASYSNIRRFLNMDNKVPPDAVRIEEMLNYFNFNNDNPDTISHSFFCNTHITTTPWNNKNDLFFINLQAPKLNFDSVPPANLVFLIDISGSMDKETRLPLLKSAFKLLAKNLRAKDSVAIVVYGGTVSILLQPTSGGEKEKIINAIEQLTPGGDTPGEAAIKMAYAFAERSFNKAGNNRVILATDGDFNVGQTTEKELEDLIIAHSKTGIYLTCLGVGMGNYKDSKLETLAKNGNGNFAYIDNLNEAEKVLIKEFSKTIYTVANDAYLSVKFNPKVVKEYRLIGFENKIEALDDSTSQLQGGEVGSGHSLMAVFELIPVEKNVAETDYLAELKLQYKLPSKDSVIMQYFKAPYKLTSIETADSSLRFAAAVTMFGNLLKQSKWFKEYSWDDITNIASTSYNTQDISQTEFLTLIEKAKKIYGDRKRKKGE